MAIYGCLCPLDNFGLTRMKVVYLHVQRSALFLCSLLTATNLSLLSFSLSGERISQQAIAQLIGDPRYLRV